MDQLRTFGNLTTQVSAVRFGLGWLLLLSGLMWMFPLWSGNRGSDPFLVGCILLGVALVARFSGLWIGALAGAGCFLASGAALYLIDPKGATLTTQLFLLGCAVLLMAMSLRFFYFVISRLQLWSVAPIFFWGVLGLYWSEFYFDDLQHAKFQIILWVVPIIMFGFVLLRRLAEALGELWVWGLVGLLSVLHAALFPFGDLQRWGQHVLHARDVNAAGLLLVLFASLCLGLLPLLRRGNTRRPFRLLRTLNSGAIFGLVPIFAAMSWRAASTGCWGPGREYSNALGVTMLCVFLLGPMMLEKANWCGEVSKAQ